MIAKDTSETFWQRFDKTVAVPAEPKVDETFGKAFTQQIKDMGCAVVDTPTHDYEGGAYAKAKTEWIKVCRGDKKMEDKWPKVALVLELAMQPLLDELKVRMRPRSEA
jgi:hypothetical protein